MHAAERVRQILGIHYPIVQGGMTFGSDARLAVAVSEAGGLGTLGTFHYRTYEPIREQVQAIQAGTQRPFSVNLPFFDKSEELLKRLAGDDGVKVFTLGGWFSEEVARLKAELGLTILVSVNAPTVARMVAERPVDVMIVQGNESGGANSHFTTRQLFDLIAPTFEAPTLLAGGQWDGADLAQALQLGAGGIQLGTRFFFCADSPLHPSIKHTVLDHNLKRPLTTALTPVTPTLNMRFITNKAWKRAREGAIQETFQDKDKVFALSAAFFEEQTKAPLIYAGTGLYKLRAIQSAAEILESIVAEYAQLRAQALPAL